MTKRTALLIGGTKMVERHLRRALPAEIEMISLRTLEHAMRQIDDGDVALLVFGPTLRRSLALVTTMRTDARYRNVPLIAVYRDDQRSDVNRHLEGRHKADAYVMQSRAQRELESSVAEALARPDFDTNTNSELLEILPMDAVSALTMEVSEAALAASDRPAMATMETDVIEEIDPSESATQLMDLIEFDDLGEEIEMVELGSDAEVDDAAASGNSTIELELIEEIDADSDELVTIDVESIEADDGQSGGNGGGDSVLPDDLSLAEVELSDGDLLQTDLLDDAEDGDADATALGADDLSDDLLEAVELGDEILDDDVLSSDDLISDELEADELTSDDLDELDAVDLEAIDASDGTGDAATTDLVDIEEIAEETLGDDDSSLGLESAELLDDIEELESIEAFEVTTVTDLETAASDGAVEFHAVDIDVLDVAAVDVEAISPIFVEALEDEPSVAAAIGAAATAEPASKPTAPTPSLVQPHRHASSTELLSSNLSELTSLITKLQAAVADINRLETENEALRAQVEVMAAGTEAAAGLQAAAATAAASQERIEALQLELTGRDEQLAVATELFETASEQADAAAAQVAAVSAAGAAAQEAAAATEAALRAELASRDDAAGAAAALLREAASRLVPTRMHRGD